MADRELADIARSIYMDALVMPPVSAPKVATDVEFRQFTEKAAQQIVREAGSSEQAVLEALDGEGDPSTVCRVGASYFRILSNLPTEEAAPIVRHMILES